MVNCVIKQGPSGVEKNLVKFGPLTKKLCAHLLTHPELTLHALHLLMHLSSGHVTLLPGEFHPSPLSFPPYGLTASGGLTLIFAPNF